MDATLKRILGLLDGADAEARCAAILVLTRLAAAERPVVEAVGAALSSKNVLVRDFAVGYFEHVRPSEPIDFVLPLLDAHEDSVRARAVGILEQYGAAAVTAARKLVKEAPKRRVNAIIDLCARVRSSSGLDLLFDLVCGDDFDVHRAACDALISAVPSLDAKAQSDLFRRTEALAASAKGRRNILVASAKLFGALADPKARKRLIAMLDPREPPVVRSHALGALVNCLRNEKLTEAELDAVFPLLEEQDESAFLRPAIRLLENQELDRRYLNPLNKLAESPQPLVKRFAVQKLASFDSAAVIKTLIGYLTDESYARRNQATASLKTMPAARTALMKELLECEDEREAWTLADILLAHDRTWKRDVTEKLWKRFEHALDKREDRLWAAYFHFLNALDAQKLGEQLRARAERLRKAKRFPDAAKTLSLLKDTPAFDDDVKFDLAAAELKSHKAGGRQAVEIFRGLAGSAFPLAERLRRDRTLTPDELYFVAFNLAEGRHEEKDVAREILQHIVAKHARTKIGKAAKNKLALLPATE